MNDDPTWFPADPTIDRRETRPRRQLPGNSRRRRRTSIGPVVELLESRTLLSVSLVSDLNTAPASTYSYAFAEAGGLLYFNARDGAHGTELWVSDGTSGGTHIVKDINPAGDSYPSELVVVNGILYFTATEPAGGTELWRSDGTEGGTHQVVDLVPGSFTSSPHSLIDSGGELLFMAFAPGGNGLWKSDGTAAGTVFIHEAFSFSVVDVGGTLYFANSRNGFDELWKSDGTPEGTVLVKTISSQIGSQAYIANLTNVAGRLFFTANDGTHGVELWTSDGTAAGTSMVLDINPIGDSVHPYHQERAAVGDRLYFAANDGTHGDEFWVSDGTPAGTRMVQDINPNSGSYPAFITELNGKAFFRAYQPDTGHVLWTSDGSDAGTMAVGDVLPGQNGIFPYGITNVGGTLYFSAYSDGTGNELWTSDGTGPGTILLRDLVPGPEQSFPTNFHAAGGRVLFMAEDSRGRELWATDGTADGTMFVRDIRPGTTDSEPYNLTAVNGTLLFTAYNQPYGNAIWRSDGSEPGTIPILNGGNHLATVGSTEYFLRFENSATELWRTDGTEAGSSKVKTLRSDSPAFSAAALGVGETLFFSFDDGQHGVELWKTDGTDAGTMLVKDINPGGAPANPIKFTALGDTLYFHACEDNFGCNLWKSDGTSNGTVRLFVPSPSGFVPVDLIAGDNVLFVNACDADHGCELWISNGTAAGTELIKDINSQLDPYGNPASSSIGPWTVVDGVLFFSAIDGLTGPALWRSDGTAAGTILVEDINPLSTDQFESLIIPLAGINGRLLFIADDGEHGRELWASDGSPEGTSLVRDIVPGMADAFEFSFQPTFADFYGTLFFPAFDPATGTELWRSDGTEAGTVLAADINPGMGSSTVRYLTAAGGRLYFSADNGMTGSELWKWEGDLAFLVSVDPNGMTSDITLRRNGPNLEVINNGDASLVGSRPAADVGRVHVMALPAGADRFTVDFRNGEFSLSRGLTFDGGPARLDELAIVGGRFGSAELRSTGAAAGTASLDRFDVFHTGVAELTLDVEIGAISFIETGDGDQSYIFNVDGSRGSDLLVLGGDNPFSGVRFTMPHESLHINMGEGRDWARLHAVSGQFPAAIMIDGGGGFDSLELVDLPHTAVAVTLAADSVTGLAGFAGPIRYAALDQLDLGLGAAAPGHALTITGTPTFETTVHLSSGADSVMVEAFAGALMIHGGDGDDSFTATAAGLDAALGGLFLLGEADSDRFLVSSRVGGVVRGGDPVGHDAATILGSDGPDALVFEGASGQSSSVLNRNLWLHDLDELTIEGGAGDDVIDASLAPAELSDLTLSGGSGNDRLTGGPGADRLLGGSDNDTMVGGPGNDTMDGGDGTDTIDFSSAPGAVTVQLRSTTNPRGAARARAKPNRRISFATGDGNDSLAGIENVIGSRFTDTITGDGSANRLDGGDGNDQLRGGDGDDILIGGLGDDRLYGDAGADILMGDAGDDYLRGGAHSDQLTGGPGIDQLLGDAGFDRLLVDLLDRLKKGGAGDEVILS